jgi:uncharacterized metal-binding protein YceD (DUF177 family)
MKLFRIETEALRTGPVTFDVDELPRDFGLEPEEGLSWPDRITGHVRAAAVGTSVILTGELRTTVLIDCVRCLEPIRVPICGKVALTYMADLAKADLERFDNLDEPEVCKYDGTVVESREDLRQIIALEVPPFPSCVLERGICPIRGVPVGKMTFGGDPETENAPRQLPPAKAKASKGGGEEEPNEVWKRRLGELRKELSRD